MAKRDYEPPVFLTQDIPLSKTFIKMEIRHIVVIAILVFCGWLIAEGNSNLISAIISVIGAGVGLAFFIWASYATYGHIVNEIVKIEKKTKLLVINVLYIVIGIGIIVLFVILFRGLGDYLALAFLFLFIACLGVGGALKGLAGLFITFVSGHGQKANERIKLASADDMID
ncbi:MAG: hypothetical protein IJL97_03410, partial [Lachnospiraceae bacterium]|nr:hypothetical protein [Lachnospiraceae bacterium]